MNFPRVTNRWKGRSGMTLVELLLAIAITALTGAAAAAVVAAVSRGMISMNDGRSGMQRGHLVNARLRTVTDPSLCVLEADTQKGFAVWLNDDRPDGRVNLTELRVFWFDADRQRITMERVQFPADWPAEWYDKFDAVVAASDDPFLMMETQRALGYTVTEVVGDRVAVSDIVGDQKQARPSRRFRLNFGITTDQGTSMPLFFAFGLPNHREPL